MHCNMTIWGRPSHTSPFPLELRRRAKFEVAEPIQLPFFQCFCCWYTVASAKFVARRGKDGNYGNGALAANFRAGCSSCSMTNSFVTNAVTGRKSCELLTSAPAPITQYLDSWLSDLLHSEQKNKIVGSRGGARAPVPHSWWRHCWYITLRCELDL